MKRTINPIVGVATLTAILALLTLSCGDQPTNAPPRTADQTSDTFTFFDVGRNSIFSKNLRRELKKVLGNDAIERRNIIDLEINDNGFLKDHFPDLDTINRQLNSPLGERVDHNTVKLMYRYARKKNVPFDYIEVVFSQYSQTPILINIRFKSDEADTLANLEGKYGPPKTIAWDQPNAKSLVWRKNEDLLIVSMIPDQIGNPRYRLAIYYTQNLKELLKAEKNENEKRRQPKSGSGKTAF
jgi:hypothetical protein